MRGREGGRERERERGRGKERQSEAGIWETWCSTAAATAKLAAWKLLDWTVFWTIRQGSNWMRERGEKERERGGGRGGRERGKRGGERERGRERGREREREKAREKLREKERQRERFSILYIQTPDRPPTRLLCYVIIVKA